MPDPSRQVLPFLRWGRHSPRNTVAVQQELDALSDCARELDLLYLPTRYPNGLDAGTPGQAFSSARSGRVLDCADRFLEVVGRIVGG